MLRVDESESEAALMALWELGTAGLAEEGPFLRAYFDDSVNIAMVREQLARWLTAADDLPDPPPTASPEPCEPILVGERFFISHRGAAAECPPGRLPLILPASSAFGTGRHETTQLVLEHLEQLAAEGKLADHSTVVDVGCGTGILSAAAKRLGAERVISCDIDPLAAEFTQREFGMETILGSVDSLRSDLADVLLVNISAKVIDLLAGELRRVARCEAHIVLTGFIKDRTPETFAPVAETERNDWLCWTGTRDGFRVSAAPSLPVQHPAQWW